MSIPRMASSPSSSTTTNAPSPSTTTSTSKDTSSSNISTSTSTSPFLKKKWKGTTLKVSPNKTRGKSSKSSTKMDSDSVNSTPAMTIPVAAKLNSNPMVDSVSSEKNQFPKNSLRSYLLSFHSWRLGKNSHWVTITEWRLVPMKLTRVSEYP